MATFTGEVEVEKPQAEVWSFVKNVDNWAHLFPGHQRHLEVETDHFSWQLRGEAGVWSRLVEFDVKVVEWSDPDFVRFSLKGRTEPVVGSGMCFAKPADSPGRSLVGFQLDAHATGPTAPMINLLLKKFVTEQSGPFLEKLAASIDTLARNRLSAAEPAVAGAEPAGAVATEDLPHQAEAGAIVTMAQGPGSVIIRYRAPRTTDCERWLRENYLEPLWADTLLTGMRRLESVAAGSVGEYQEVLDTRDLAGTVRHVAGLLGRIRAGAGELGIAFEPEPFVSRRIYRRRAPWRLFTGAAAKAPVRG